ncbi:MAG TPA: hypothetical protein VFQ53_11980 [Kofleriaceae bacterium]|nr:hypothetical protein [Kofleriaceae bacterium]
MIAIVAAAPGELLAPLVEQCRAVDTTELWTPLGAPDWLARTPGSLGRYAQRRTPGDRTAPGVLAVDAALRAWAGSATDRRYRAELALRVAIDHWAAREVRRRRPRIVIAPTLAARRTLAAARAIGAKAILVVDLPLLRALHRDLDRAAEHWPERRFLRRFRAPSSAIARQDAERVLADLILVRGPYAHRLCLDDGIAASRLAMLPLAPGPRLARGHAGRLRLAGLAAARHGLDTALAAARMLGMTLVVRTGEGTEPANLADLPGVATDDAPVDAVICPAICEVYAPELRATGVPVIASPMASRDGTGPDPYDPSAFAAAIATALTDEPAPSPQPASLSSLLATL